MCYYYTKSFSLSLCVFFCLYVCMCVVVVLQNRTKQTLNNTATVQAAKLLTIVFRKYVVLLLFVEKLTTSDHKTNVSEKLVDHLTLNYKRKYVC
jgi:cytochrome bd-type quinol oxidase subunit 2